MTKRIIALFLFCILAIPILATPASASGWDAGDSTTLQEIEADTDYLPIMWDVWQDFFDSWDGMFANIEYYTSHIKADLRLFYEDWDVWEDEVIAAFSTLGDKVQSVVDSIISGTSSIGDAIKHMEDAIEAKLDHHWDRFTSRWDAILPVWTERFEATIGKIEAMQNALSTKIETLQSALSERLDGIKSILLGTPEDLEQAEQVGDRVDNQTGELEDAVEQIESIPKVDADSLDAVLSDYTDYLEGELSQGYFQLISNVLGLFSTVFFPSVMFAILGYILYGKRF